MPPSLPLTLPRPQLPSEPLSPFSRLIPTALHVDLIICSNQAVNQTHSGLQCERPDLPSFFVFTLPSRSTRLPSSAPRLKTRVSAIIVAKTADEKLNVAEYFIKTFAFLGDVKSCLALRYYAIAVKRFDNTLSCFQSELNADGNTEDWPEHHPGCIPGRLKNGLIIQGNTNIVLANQFKSGENRPEHRPVFELADISRPELAFYSNNSFHVLHSTHLYLGHEEAEGPEEEAAPAPTSLYQHSQLD
ncbi:hypothetical protein MA16_Dca021969 [Dendrobium catenatum]|uniref:Uncharacterized protein n=1 Tax=Dendrobium catenatum TaxID=906689 RepID=A0A2I0VYH6_9ASPA|nr:hypothetical protein MA16_Dca021969 [Dendrobium catenatum]